MEGANQIAYNFKENGQRKNAFNTGSTANTTTGTAIAFTVTGES